MSLPLKRLLMFFLRIKYRRKCIKILSQNRTYIAVFENFYKDDIIINWEIFKQLKLNLKEATLLKYSVAVIRSKKMRKIKKGKGIIVGEVDALAILPNGRALLIEIKSKMPRPGTKIKVYANTAYYLKKVFGFKEYVIVMLLKNHTIDRAYVLKRYAIVPYSFLIKMNKEDRSIVRELALL